MSDHKTRPPKAAVSKIDTGVTKKPSGLTITAPRQMSRPSSKPITRASTTTKATISSKINTGVPKKSSTFTITESRSSRNCNPVDVRETKASHSRSRSRLSSARLSSESQLGIPDDKIQRGLHKLGTIPTYLKKAVRPATATATTYRSESTSAAVADLPAKRTTSVPKLSTNQPDADQQQQVAKEPPYEGTTDSAAQKVILQTKQELQALKEHVKQIEQKCKGLEADYGKQVERASQLECELKARNALLQELEQSIGQLKKDGNEDLDKTIIDLRNELCQKCGELIKSQYTLEKLKQKLIDVETAREEEETKHFELQEKLAEKETKFQEETTHLEQSNQKRKLKIEQLQTQLRIMSRELAEKDAIIGSLKAQGAVELSKEAAALADTPEALQAEVVSLRAELAGLADTKRRDDVLLDIRTQLMHSLEASNESFRKQCEKCCNFVGEDEVDCHEVIQLEGVLDDGQRNDSNGEQIINEVEQNNRKCRTIRQKILSIIKQLQKENRQMKEVMSNCGPDLLGNGAKNNPNPELKDQILEQINNLFPNSIPLPEDDSQVEQITRRINYEIESECITDDVQSLE